MFLHSKLGSQIKVNHIYNDNNNKDIDNSKDFDKIKDNDNNKDKEDIDNKGRNATDLRGSSACHRIDSSNDHDPASIRQRILDLSAPISGLSNKRLKDWN